MEDETYDMSIDEGALIASDPFGIGWDQLVADLDSLSIRQDVEEVIEEAPTQTPIKKEHEVEVYNNHKLSKDYERLIRMTQVVSKFASTLTLKKIRVGIEHDRHSGISAPAWSDSSSITFNHHVIGPLDTPEEVTAIKGLSLHEICHILLTPREGTKLVKEIRSLKLWEAFNMLEDMRIETFICTKYSNVSEWLTATIVKFLLDNTNGIVKQFPLIYGRKYLPVEVRTMVRDAYLNPGDIVQLEAVIDKYIVLNLSDPSKYKEALELIIEYNKLVHNIDSGNTYGQGWSNIHDPNGHLHGNRKNGEWKPVNGKPLNKAEQDKLARKVNVDNGKDYDKKPGEGEGDGGQEDGSNPSSSPSSDSGMEAPNNGSDGTGNGVGHGESDRQRNVQTLNDLLKDIYESKKEEIEDAIKQFNGEVTLTSAPMTPPPRHSWVNTLEVSPEAVVASRSFGTELEQLRADHDPAWNRKTESGRLNVQRYGVGCEIDEAFDQWEMGREDAVDIECVILLDTSSSMSWCIRDAFESMWSVKRALDKINASTTVVTFDAKAQLLYSANERAGIAMKHTALDGSTEPEDAIKYAYSVLANSNRAIKIVIAITDGQWYDNKNCDRMLSQLRKAGVITALAYVSNPMWLSEGQTIKIDSHGCEVATNITKTSDLFTLARKLVKAGVGRNLA
jgi:hypothetical protein